MSFNRNGQRYGHVPPVQYGAQQPQPPMAGLQRQSSFNDGDDAPYFDSTTRPPPNITSPSMSRPVNASQDELFMADSSPHWQPQVPQQQVPQSYGLSNTAFSGYQHQYQPSQATNQPAAQTPPTYNPQQFARTYSQHQAPSVPYPQQPYQTPPLGYGSHQPYNPAAYQPQPHLQRQQTLPSYGHVPAYNAPAQQVPQPTGYWSQPAQYAPNPPISARPTFEQQPNNLPYVPASSAPPQPRPAPYTPTISSAPYPTNGTYPNNEYAQRPMQMPSANSYTSYEDPTSYSNRISRSSSSSAPPAVEPAIATLQRHPTLRPLPTAPVEEDTESDWDESHADMTVEAQAQEQIYQEIEAAVGASSSAAAGNNSDLLDNELGDLQRYNSQATTLNPTGVERFPSTASTAVQHGQATPYEFDDDESDAEAAAGLEAMRLAEEEDNRRGSGNFGLYDNTSKPLKASEGYNASSDSDYANVDMGLYGGGIDVGMSYRDDLTGMNAGNSSEMDDESRPLPTSSELHRSESYVPVTGLGGMTDYSIPGDSTIHPFPAFEQSRVDMPGTGGFHRPSPQGHRRSFDEGDEQASLGSRYAESRLSGRSGSESPIKDDIPEMFYHPGMSSSSQRPLPAVPSLHENRAPLLQSAGAYRNSQYGYSYSSQVESRPGYPPDGPDAYPSQELLSPNGQFVPRSASLSSHSSTPLIVPPVRSRTDAEERQARMRALRQQGMPGASMDGFDASTPQSSIPLDLPALPLGRRRKISPENLRSADFKKCKEPWALSNIAEWAKEMCGGETGDGESDLRERTIVDCFVELFIHKVPTMNTADAETLSSHVVSSMIEAGLLIREEEWIKFGQGEISGVMWQLSGSGCYAPRLHEQEVHGRCYSHHCHRTLKKINLQAQALEPAKKSEDWPTFFKITKEQIDAADQKEIKRQYNLHEIVMSEDKYMDRLNVLRILYRDELQSWQPPIIAPNKLGRFITQVFGKVEAIKKANEDHLLAQLKYRQQEQGPWIGGFSDIFREWIRRARQVYMDYAAGYPQANFLVRREAEKNLLFRQFLEQARDNKLSERLDWNTYLFAPLKRLQQYTLLLKEVQKHTFIDNEEKMNLATAIDEINNVTLECDAKVDEMAKKVEMAELTNKLYLRPGMERVELNLDHLGRQLIFKGDLQRAGANRFTWLETHAILFDHYLVLAKTVAQRDTPAGGKKEIYDVSKLPIPMELLVLESTNDDAVVKSSVKGLATVTTVARPTTSETRINRATTNGERPTSSLEHTNTNNSISTVSSTSKTVTSTNLDENAKSMFPFRVKHLGKSEVYTLYAPTAQNRQDWCEKIIEAKERHARSLFAQNAEPFRLRVMADTAFAYDAASATGKAGGIPIRGTPLDRAIREMEREYGGARQAPICRAIVNCATTFSCYGKSMVAIGTDYGVYTAEANNPRGWTRSIQMNRVTQIEILEDFNICLIISDKSVIAYPLDVIVPVSSFPAPKHDSARRAPQKLSGARDVSFFATARMKDRTLLFYKKRDGLSSTFKVLEPVYQKSNEKKSKLFGRGKLNGGNTEFFREFDDFYIPTECFTINLFHTYIAVSTQRGFELLTLDKKVTMSIPDLKQPSIANIAARLSGQKPLGMYRKSETEFLLCYEECGVYIDKHGEVSRSVVLEFIGKAKSAAMYGAYLVLFDNDFVEVRNAENGRLRQVIAGKDVRCIDYGVAGASSGGQRTLKIAMAHPEMPGSQLVLEMLLNEGQRE